jgi:UDP-glucose 4-epimerase
LTLLEVMLHHDVRNMIFSSSAAVYGIPQKVPIPENESIKPISPYARSKATVETVLDDLSKIGRINFIALRYFNAAGADPAGRIGERHSPETHLIPLALRAAKGERETLTIYGTDYSTPDGTCVRDYIHVEDLADAHLRSLDYLTHDGRSNVFNCGYGHGFSVREIIQTVKKVTRIDFNVSESERRPGDPPVLIADSSKIQLTLDWKPRYDDLDYIIRTAWHWEKNRRNVHLRS